MADEVISVEQENKELDQVQNLSQLEVLKGRATLMGIPFSNNIGVEALLKKIEEKMASDEPEVNEEEQPEANPLDGTSGKKVSLQKFLRDREMKLMRVRIQNLDPKKADLQGEMFTIANKYLGTVRKYIPYGEASDQGYHIPYFIYKALKRRKFLNLRTKKANHGTDMVEYDRWTPEFAIDVLPDLTPDELAKLAKAQLAAGTSDLT